MTVTKSPDGGPREEAGSRRPWVHLMTLDIKEEFVSEFLWRVQEQLDAMRHEKTFVSTSLCAHPDEPGKFLLFEVWEDRDEFLTVQRDRDYRRPHAQRFREMLRSPPVVAEWYEVRADYAMHLRR